MKISKFASVAMCTVVTVVMGSCGLKCYAQKEGAQEAVGIFESRAEYNSFMGMAKEMAYGPDGNAELQAMIPLLNDIALQQPIGSTAGKYNAQASNLGLLANKQIREELDMVDSQYEELKQVNEEIQEKLADQIRELDFSNPAEVTKQIQKLREEAQKELDAVLLPHQGERLRQLQVRSQLRRRSLAEIITSDPVKSDLEITDQQSRELREAEREIERELQEEIAKLREKARERFLDKLKPSQKEQVREMIGESFDFQKSSK